MANKISAGLLMYRRRRRRLEVFLVHPGGPWYRKKDTGAWSVAKGESDGEDDLFATACREFEEEVGLAPEGPFLPLGTVKQRGGKVVHAWAFAGDWEDGRKPQSNTFEMEWPLRSGKMREYPEVDKAEFFSIPMARMKINPAQVAFLDRLLELLHAG